MIAKNELRKLISNKKEEFSVASKIEKSKYIFEKVKQLKGFTEAQNILCYWSMPDEVDTHDFVMEISRKKNVFLPVIEGDDLQIRKFSGVDNLKKNNSFPVFEPDHSDNVEIKEIDLVLVPGVAFDLEGKRIGRGKGYYDRLLAGSDVYKVGICFDFQMVESVPVDKHDIVMNQIIFG